jgi:hypothetical protein
MGVKESTCVEGECIGVDGRIIYLAMRLQLDCNDAWIFTGKLQFNCHDVLPLMYGWILENPVEMMM